MDVSYRHEWKHVLNTGDLLVLRQRLRAVLESDPHAINGKYQVRSLYFDTLRDKALRRKSTASTRGRSSGSACITAIVP